MRVLVLWLILCCSAFAQSPGFEDDFGKGDGFGTKVAGSPRAPQNVVGSSEVFADWWGASGVTQGEHLVLGPDGETYAELWAGDGILSSHNFFYFGGAGNPDFTAQKKQVLSIYVSPFDTGGEFTISAVDGATTYSGGWTWSGASWSLTTELNTSDNGIDDVGGGWYRAWFYVNGEDAAGGSNIVGHNPWNLIFNVSQGTVNSLGHYYHGIQLEYGVTRPNKYVPKGTETFPMRVVKRGVPNDFWYTANFALDQQNGYGSGDCGAFYSDSSRPGFWIARDEQMDLERAWGIQTEGAGVVLMDLEIAEQHYDLAANIYTNSGEVVDGTDSDGNGLVDDIGGWDFVDWDNTTGFNLAQDDIEAIFAAPGVNQHGTQMAAFIGAVGNNEAGVNNVSSQGSVGVCWDLDILPAKVLAVSGYDSYNKDHPDEPGSTLGPAPGVRQILTIQYAVWLNENAGANFKIASMSFSTTGGVVLDALQEEEILPFMGAGNANTGSVSAAYDGADTLVVVGAVTTNGETGNKYITLFAEGSSNFASRVDLCGYAGRDFYFSKDNGYVDLSARANSFLFTIGYGISIDNPGVLNWCENLIFDPTLPEWHELYGMIPTESLTSGATAQAAGLGALLSGLYPDLSAGQIKGMLERGCVTDIYDGRNSDQCDSGDCAGLLGAGRMNAYRTLTMWGTVTDTTLSGDVYVSGDVFFDGITIIADNTTFHIAPQDIYESEISPGVLVPQSQYLLPVLNPAAPDSEDKVEIYFGGTVVSMGTGIAFQSDATNTTDFDWGGIWVQSGTGTSGTPTVTGTLEGDF